MADMKRYVSLLVGNQRIPKYRHPLRDTLAKKNKYSDNSNVSRLDGKQLFSHVLVTLQIFTTAILVSSLAVCRKLC